MALADTVAHAAVAYDLTSRAPGDAARAPVTVRYLVEDEAIRVEPHAGSVILMKDDTWYEIDNTSKTVLIRAGATLDNLEESLADTARQSADEAAKSPADSQAQLVAEVIKELARPPQVTLDLRMTDRSEMVEGRACRIWEERKDGARWLELCVLPAASLPGGAEILAGMKAMCRYINGSALAFGVLYGRIDPWPYIQRLGGVPVRVRELSKDAPVTETTLTASHLVTRDAALLEVPAGYTVKQQGGH